MTADVDTIEADPQHDFEPHDGSVSWTVSLCFWFALLLAVAVYASVALSPKFAVWNKVRAEYQNNVRQLVALEDDVEYLERVELALETDPEFVQRLAGVSKLSSDSPGEELIPVSGSLLFGQGDEVAALEIAVVELPFYQGIILRLASDEQLRTLLLSFSACLTIFAFTFLNDAGQGAVCSAGSMMKQVIMLPMHRYFSDARTAAEAESQHAADDSESGKNAP